MPLKLEIFPPAKVPEPAQQPLRLALKMYGSHIRLVCVDERGDVLAGGSILDIRPDGSILRHAYISEGFGLSLEGPPGTGTARVKIVN